ncbi:MAG: PKD domain-containing protein [Reichenbachiella sp.]|uniref:PKD domain-containing protein n=1 Tax=Reichenbachiella sp. TaxID=2184521 RepID=UPI003299F224
MRKTLLISGIVMTTATLFLVSIQKSTDLDKKSYEQLFEKYDKVKDLSYEEIKNLPKRDRPDLALLQEFETTKDLSLGYPPIKRKVEAFKVARERLARKSQARTIDNIEWNERGPNNVGGRTRALMFDPNDDTNKKVWAGGISGGIWYNSDITDSDVSWVNVDDFMTNLSICSFAYDPGTTTTFYAGTGESWTNDFRGTGIWKSTDSGDSWNQLSSTEDFGYTTKIVVTSDSKIIAATSNGIKTSTDGGDNWSSPSTVDINMSDLEIAEDGTLICSGFIGDIYKSTNDGESWTDISPSLGGNRVETAIAPSNSDVFYAAAAQGSDIGWMAVSTDEGSNWTEITIPSYLDQSTCQESSSDFSRGQAWYDLILAVNPSDEDEVIVGGIDLHKSTDGGTTWTAISYWTGSCAPYVHADQHAIVFKPGSSSEAIFGNDGGVSYSDDIDQESPTFETRNNDYNVTQFYALAMRNEVNSNDMLAGSQDNGTQQYSTSGINSTNEATGGDGAYCFIDQNEPDIQITSYVYNNYYLSRDGGASFNGFGVGDSGGFINQSDYDSDANILYARGNDDNVLNVYTITDSDINTSTISIEIGGEATHILASPYEDNVLYIGSDLGTVTKVTNANTSNPSTEELFDTSGTVTSIDINENGDKMLVTIGNYGANSVWFSADGGENWVDIEGDLPDMPVWWGMFTPNSDNQVILATEVGVWSSSDISATDVEWGPVNEGLANVSSRMLQYRTSDQRVGVATHGRGLFTSSSFSSISFADFSADSYVTYIGKEVEFTNESEATISSTSWTITDGSSYTTEDITHTFDEAGWHKVTLEINGELTKTKKIFVLPNRTVNYVCEIENEPVDTYADNIKGEVGFELGNSTIDGKDGVTSGESAWVLGLEDETYTDESETHIYFPEYDFSADGTYTISFQTNYSFEAQWDGFIVEYTIDQGDNWVKLGSAVETGWYNQTSDAQSVFGESVPIFSGSTDGYELKSKDVSGLAGNPNVTFRLVYMSDAAEVEIGMALDDFSVTGPDADIVPDFSIPYQEEHCTESTIVFYQNCSIGTESYNWDFGDGASPESATGKGPHEVFYSTTGDKTVSLTITDDSETEFTETKTDFISVLESMTSSASISISESDICKGDDATFLIDNSEDGKTYQVFDNESNEAVSETESGTGDLLEIAVSDIDNSGEFYVEIAKDGYCKVYSDILELTVTDIKETELSDSEITICEGDIVSIGIENSIEGVSYQLVFEESGENTGNPKAGNGDTIILTSDELTSDTVLSVKAESENADCELKFASTVAITTIAYPDVTITESDFILTVEEGADNYQWYIDERIILDANSNSYEATMNGVYFVIAQNGNCEATSDNLSLIVSGIEEADLARRAYPNPSTGTISFDIKEPMQINIYAISGELVIVKELNASKVVDLGNLQNGLYIIESITNGTRQKQTVVLNK